MNHVFRPECPLIWQCKETKEEMTRMNITKEVSKEERPGMERLIEYVKKIGLCNGI
jgi:hypothetical protein